MNLLKWRMETSAITFGKTTATKRVMDSLSSMASSEETAQTEEVLTLSAG